MKDKLAALNNVAAMVVRMQRARKNKELNPLGSNPVNPTNPDSLSPGTPKLAPVPGLPPMNNAKKKAIV